VTTRELVLHWLFAFALTQVVECLIYVRAFRVRALVAFGASTLTHPIVVFAIPALWEVLYLAIRARWPAFRLGDEAYFVGYGILAESFAVGAEAAYLATVGKLGARRGIVASLVANAASGGVGLLCSWLTGWP